MIIWEAVKTLVSNVNVEIKERKADKDQRMS